MIKKLIFIFFAISISINSMNDERKKKLLESPIEQSKIHFGAQIAIDNLNNQMLQDINEIHLHNKIIIEHLSFKQNMELQDSIKKLDELHIRLKSLSEAIHAVLRSPEFDKMLN